ncbi:MULTISPECIES: hypothetical protein [unclassified Streptomyces]
MRPSVGVSGVHSGRLPVTYELLQRWRQESMDELLTPRTPARAG